MQNIIFICLCVIRVAPFSPKDPNSVGSTVAPSSMFQFTLNPPLPFPLSGNSLVKEIKKLIIFKI